MPVDGLGIEIEGITPTVDVKEYTVKDIYDAIEKNGFDHLRGVWFTPAGKFAKAGGCVLGQAGMNLGVHANTHHTEKNTIYFELNQFIVETRAGYEGPLADTIIDWNDATDPNGGQYVLPTYKDVVDKCKELMEPYFDKVVYLKEYDYTKEGVPYDE